MKKETLTVRLTEEEKIKLERLQSLWQVRSIGEVVRRLIDQSGTIDEKLLSVLSHIDTAVVDESTVFVTAGQLQKFHQNALDLQPLLLKLSRRLADHVKIHGWPMPPCSYGFGEILADLRSGGTRKSAAFIKSRYFSFWAAGESPVRLATQPEELEKLFRYRLGINDTGEMFDITLSEMRRAFIIQRKTVSFFQPKHAFDLYLKYLSEHTNPVVWDPSCGFGARLLGFYAAFPAGVYYGNEPASLTYKDNQSLAEDLGLTAGIEQKGSEFGNSYIEANSVDLVFTSPPYFDKEKYFDEPTQAWYNRTETEWVRHYLKPTLQQAYTYLKPDGLLILNVDHADCYLKAAEDVGFILLSDADWKVRKHHFARRKNKDLFSTERLLVWRKK